MRSPYDGFTALIAQPQAFGPHYQDRALHLQCVTLPRNVGKSGRHDQLVAVYLRSQQNPYATRRSVVRMMLGRATRKPLLLWQGLPGSWLAHWHGMSKRGLRQSVPSGFSTPFTLSQQSFQGVRRLLLTSTAFSGYRRFIHLGSRHEDIQFVYQPFVAVRWSV